MPHRDAPASPPGAPRGRRQPSRMQVPLQRIMPGSQFWSQISIRAAPRTHVRFLAVRRPSYLTNTCSPPRQRTSLRSARSVLYVWPARSCCSRTTTRSTGRSARTSAPPYRIRTGRRCAEGAPSVAPASCQRGRRRVSRRWRARAPCPMGRVRAGRMGRAGAGRSRSHAAAARASLASSSWGAAGRAESLTDATHDVVRVRTTTGHPKAARVSKKPAASYSPRPLRAKYHRR